MKNIRVRRAKSGDRELFRKLWMEYLHLEEAAGHIKATEKNLEVFSNIFDAYVAGEMAGIVLLVAECGVLMWGEQGPQLFDSPLGRSATGWGTYVQKKFQGKGISKAMRTKACNILRDMGFDTVTGTLDSANQAGYSSGVNFGFQPVTTIVTYSLKEKKD